MRLLYLINQKEFLPFNEVLIPHWSEGFPCVWWGITSSLAGRDSFQWMRLLYIIDRKEIPSVWWGFYTLLTRRNPFQPMRMLYLINQKEFLPVNEFFVSCQPEGIPSTHGSNSQTPSSMRGGFGRQLPKNQKIIAWVMTNSHSWP
jgi:hypothetical protein